VAAESVFADCPLRTFTADASARMGGILHATTAGSRIHHVELEGQCISGHDMRIAFAGLFGIYMKVRFDPRKYPALESVSEYPAD